MKHPLPSLPLVVLDTETTGFVPRTHRVIEFASVWVEEGKVTDTFDQLFFAEEIPPHVEVLTRIRTEDLRDKPRFEELRNEVAARLPEHCIIVGQNVGFDIGMLKGEGIDLSERPWIDTSILASLVFPELESYSLGYLSTVLHLNHAPKHRALGDVHATLELLGKCWERLLELPEPLRKEAQDVLRRGSAGYRLLFDALPASKAKKTPAWLTMEPQEPPLVATKNDVPLLTGPKAGTIALREESLDPAHFLSVLLRAAETPVTDWVAVKNLDAFVRRLPAPLVPKLRVLYPPSHLLDPEAVRRLETAENLTADEATLLVKIRWYKPVTRNDLPLHGGEETVWRGALACTDSSQAYLDQFSNLPTVVLIDHRQFLHILETPDHPANQALARNAHAVIDDASMLEDTATKAYGWYCSMGDLRAASTQSERLMKLTDLAQLWIEKVRQSQPIRNLTVPDLGTPETKGLRMQIRDILTGEKLPPQITVQLECLEKILTPENVDSRFAWIEIRQDGSQHLQSVPEHLSALLKELLYDRVPTTLLLPPGSAETVGEILPGDVTAVVEATGTEEARLPVAFPIQTLQDVLASPPSGKTVILLPGKGTIENLYVKYTEMFEEKGITLICQGIGGGQGRMRAEFLAAPAPTVWLLTPWVFEGIELPPDTVDHLIITQLPFDYYSHPVLSRRSARYRNGFEDYFFPRLLHRLFRLLRTFSRFKKPDGDVRILDERVRTKGYGKDVIQYMKRFSIEGETEMDNGKLIIDNSNGKELVPEMKSEKPKKASKKKKGEEGQMTMF
ncbi:MAG: exonuclease domain-containing protein [Candidatus Peribacteraceae bacterium]|nr:exonuclease domain-containing protein [Candidatus Peribacteraceae bacterium]